MKNKVYILKFREVNRDIFNAIKKGAKKIETRAATKKYRNISIGDKVKLVCGSNKIIKQVKKVEFFNSIATLLKKYTPQMINPNIRTAKEAWEMWHSFPNYKEKIKKHGLIVIHLKQYGKRTKK
ncbi:MAG: hypothetical protein HYT27_00105 [Parcubacteria group bacterium]|nr:hypothetical protein [Parcubacteria group bacterium]